MCSLLSSCGKQDRISFTARRLHNRRKNRSKAVLCSSAQEGERRKVDDSKNKHLFFESHST